MLKKLSKAEVRDQNHHSAIANLMSENVGSVDGYWINLNDIDEEGSYLWQTTLQILDPNEFEAWGTSQPDGGPAENCVAAPKEHYFFWYKHFIHRY